MSKNETASPSPRIQISKEVFPNPPWTNIYFNCSHCGARYQLGCADELRELPRIELESRCFETPPCWTCDKVSVLKIPFDEPEGNPS